MIFRVWQKAFYKKVKAKNKDILTSIEGEKIWLIEKDVKDPSLEEFAYVNKIAIAKIKNNIVTGIEITTAPAQNLV